MHGEEGGCLKHLTDHGYEPLRGTMPIELFSKLPDHSGFDPMAADTPSMLLTSVNINHIIELKTYEVEGCPKKNWLISLPK